MTRSADKKDDATVNDQGFKKTYSEVTPSSENEPIENLNDKYMKEPPVHDANVAATGHDTKNGQAHDAKTKYPPPGQS